MLVILSITDVTILPLVHLKKTRLFQAGIATVSVKCQFCLMFHQTYYFVVVVILHMYIFTLIILELWEANYGL